MENNINTSREMTAEVMWKTTNQFEREKVLISIGWQASFAKDSWRKLPYFVRLNLNNRKWMSKN